MSSAPAPRFTLPWEHALYPWLMENCEGLIAATLLRADSLDKTWAGRVDKPTALAAVLAALSGTHTALRAVVLNDSHVLLYGMGTMWWNPTPMLIEQMFIRVARGDSTAALAAIDLLAASLGAHSIAFGTNLARNDAALSRLLGRAGYTLQSHQLIKDIPWVS